MRALSLPQPWASLWLDGPKEHEIRTFRTSYRGWLVVHASKTIERPSAAVAAICRVKYGDGWFANLPRGALLGAVYLHDCVPSGIARKRVTIEDLLCDDFSAGRWAWRRMNVTIRFDEPIEHRGESHLFEVDDALLPRAPFAVAS